MDKYVVIHEADLAQFQKAINSQYDLGYRLTQFQFHYAVNSEEAIRSTGIEAMPIYVAIMEWLVEVI